MGRHYPDGLSPDQGRRYIAEKNAERTFRKQGALRPPISLPYRVLARTCPKCGTLITTPDHLIRKDASKRLPNCGICKVRESTKRRRDRKASDEAFREEERKRVHQGNRTRYVNSLPGAYNKGKEWTGPELEMVARSDLSTVYIAEKLGRTYYAVKFMRRKLRDDPRKARLAGLDTPAARKAQP